MENLKQKTINGVSWSFLDGLFGQGLYFIVGIILARILSPREFGLIGMTTIFIAISQTFIDSGFSSALIRKKDCTSADFSTVFYFNVLVSISFAVLLFFASTYIAIYFKEDELKSVIQVLSCGIIITSIGTIQQIIFSKNLDFKTQTKISIVASIASGSLAISLALLGFGIWSLVFFTLSKYLTTTLLYWYFSSWRPEWIFSKKSFFELFGFGSKILASSLLNTLYEQIYFIIIGKYYSAAALGQYTRADQFKALPSQQLTSIISKVSFPVFSRLQDDTIALRNSFIRVVRTTMFLSSILMFGLAAVSQNLVLALLNPQWTQSIIYLQLLCFVGVLYPLHALNLNILLVKGHSNVFLKLEILKKILGIPVILIAIFLSIKYMILAMAVLSFLSYFINAYWTSRLLNYSVTEQISDILPSLLVALFVASIVYTLGFFLHFGALLNLVIQLLSAGILVFIIGELNLSADYKYLKTQLLEKIQSFRNPS